MVDSLWDWFDEGKNALDSFKEYAGDTFRDIASDMLRTLIMKNVFGDYQDDIAKLYEDYSISEGTASDLTKLNEGVNKYTQELMDRYAEQLPALQSMITQIGASMEGIGINLKDTESSKSGIVANVQSLTEDTGNRLYGVVNGSYGHLSAIRAMYEGNSQSVMSNIYNIMEAYYPNVVNQIAIGNAELIKINNNTLRSANNSDGILSAVEELRTTVKRVTTSGSGTKINT
jgi:phage-related protein